MLSNKKIVCPNNLIDRAKKIGLVNAAIVNAGEILPMESTHKAVQNNLINPIFVGMKLKLKNMLKNLNGIYQNIKLLMKRMKIPLRLWLQNLLVKER